MNPAVTAPASSYQIVDEKNQHGWRRVIRNFSPSWFSVTMGTGIVSLIFYSIPYQAAWLRGLGNAFFVLNVVLFTLFTLASILRYSIWPEIWTVMINDPVNSLFLGTFPMGFATIVEMWVFVCVPAWGPWAAYAAWGMWIADTVVAVMVTIGLGIMLMSASYQRSLDTITAAQLLPIAATIVASATGSEVAGVLDNPNYAHATVIVCYVLWGMAVPLAFSVIVIYYQRLALHKMPPREVIVSAFLPLGPLGLGGFAILQMGRVAQDVFPKTGILQPHGGDFARLLGFFIAILMWSWGVVFFALALASIYKSRPFPFNMGWWGFTFPLGVWSISAISIGEELNSAFFKVLGTICSTAVVLLWIVIAAGTVRGAWTGALFNAPCLANLKPEPPSQEPGPEVEEKQIETATPSGGLEDIKHRRGAAGG